MNAARLIQIIIVAVIGSLWLCDSPSKMENGPARMAMKTVTANAFQIFLPCR